MLATRVIPTLLLQGTGLVKGKKFKKHQYIGDPINAVKIFNEKEVDEIVFLDISATLQNKEPNYELIESIASQAFIPLAYGGGITNLEQIKKIFSLGVEKIILNTSAVKTPNLIVEASDYAGVQSIVVSIDINQSFLGKQAIYTRCGTEKTDLDIVEFAKKVESLGAGEIIINSISREGSKKGYDTELIKLVSEQVSIPVIASGGAGNIDDFRQARNAGAAAVAAGSMFVFHGKHDAVLITYPDYTKLTKMFKENK